MAAPRKGVVSPSRRAALAYLAGGTTIQACADRFRVSLSSVHQTLCRMRRQLRNDGHPEDELSC